MKNEKYIDSDGQELTKMTTSDGHQYYINKKEKYHRLDGPAMIWKYGTKFWYKNGKQHRDDGPATIYSDGTEKYYLEGKRVSKREVDLYWIKKQVQQ